MKIELKHQARKNSAGLHGCLSVLMFFFVGIPIFLYANYMIYGFVDSYDPVEWNSSGALIAFFAAGLFSVWFILWRALLRDISKLDGCVATFVFLFNVLPCIGAMGIFAMSCFQHETHVGWNTYTFFGFGYLLGCIAVSSSYLRTVLRDRHEC